MKNTIKYVGLDVSKEKIAVAIADEGRESARYYGAIPHTPDAVARMIRKLKGLGITLEVCYEAGPTGYDLYRWLTKMGISCVVIAPSRMPQRPGDAIKPTDGMQKTGSAASSWRIDRDLCADSRTRSLTRSHSCARRC